MNAPTTMHSTAAIRRSVSTLSECARRTPATTPASSNPVINPATLRSICPYVRLPAVPNTAATICSTWLVPTAARGTKPASTIIGTEKSGPPAPDSPEPNPDTAPTPASSARSPGVRPSRKCSRLADGRRMYKPANTMIAAMRSASGRASIREAAHAPSTLKTTAPAHTGLVIRQSIEPRRWNRTVPRMPVKTKVKSAVAAAVWTVSPPR
jgi:hypothetical protein